MEYIVRYENFNESKGISDSCENVLYKIWNLIEYDILNLKSNSILYDINEVDFNVKELKVEFTINKSNERRCYGETNLKGTIISNNSLIGSSINLNIKIDEIDDKFIYYIKSVLLHELLHLFQHYNILKDSKFRPQSFSIGSIIPQLRKLVKTKYGEYLLDILYYSLPHELSAQLHQYYLYRVNGENYDKLAQITNFLKNFNIDSNHNDDISFIKNHIKNSIKFYVKNKKYLSDINKSLWSIDDNLLFLKELKSIIDNRLKWIDKKIKLIDSKINEPKTIRYDEWISLPTNWDDHDYNDSIKYQKFIIDNLNDCPKY
jgi:hypothetical protein